jgi:hypothetical protein
MKPTFLINNSYNSPENTNYDILGLHKDEHINAAGELYLVNYYQTYNGATYSGLVLVENRTYTRNAPTSLVIYRTQVTQFYLTDGTIGATKTTIKYYPMQDAIQEGITRRNNVISQAKLYVMGTVGLANGQAYMVSNITNINIYIEGYTTPLITAVGATNLTTFPFITPTVIATLTAILTLPY